MLHQQYSLVSSWKKKIAREHAMPCWSWNQTSSFFVYAAFGRKCLVTSWASTELCTCYCGHSTLTTMSGLFSSEGLDSSVNFNLFVIMLQWRVWKIILFPSDCFSTDLAIMTGSRYNGLQLIVWGMIYGDTNTYIISCKSFQRDPVTNLVEIKLSSKHAIAMQWLTILKLTQLSKTSRQNSPDIKVKVECPQ